MIRPQVRRETVWQLDVVEQLAVLLYNTALTYEQIGEILTRQTGHRITKGAVIGFCQRQGLTTHGKERGAYRVRIRKPAHRPRVRYEPPKLIPGTITLVNLDGGCCWPCSDGEPPYLYCGKPRVVRSYCAEHAARAFQPARGK